MSPRATFERVYFALKQQLGSGRFPPGAHLEPAALSEELSASVTPVRDALHRLLGERLVIAPPGDGFRVPLLTEAGLRDMYHWSGQVLALALRTAQRDETAAGSAVEGDRLQRTEALFRSISAGSGSGELHAVMASLNDRLRWVRVAEGRALRGLDDELATLETAYRSGNLAELRKQLARYHRRRDRLTPEIVGTLHPLF